MSVSPAFRDERIRRSPRVRDGIYELSRRATSRIRPVVWLLAGSLSAGRIFVWWTSQLALLRDRYVEAAVYSVVTALVFASRGALVTWTRNRAQAALHEELTDALLRADLREGAESPHEVHIGLIDGVLHAGRAASEFVPSLWGEALAAAVLVVVIGSTLPLSMTLTGFVALAAAAPIVYVLRGFTAREGEKSWDAYGEVVDTVAIALGGRLEVLANGREPSFRARAHGVLRKWEKLATRSDVALGLAGRGPLVLAAALVVLALFGGAIFRGGALGEALAQAIVWSTLLPPFGGLLAAWQSLTRLDAPARTLHVALHAPRLARRDGRPPPSPIETLTFSEVSFAYPHATRAVLDKLSFAWRRPDVLFLAGPNGSGKSTCLRLLAGLDTPRSGSILVNGQALEAIDGASWAERIAFLPQRPFFPQGATVRQAMTFVCGEIPDDELEVILGAMGLAERLRSHPSDPLATRIADLSAGERQRVAIARVFARPAEVLLLDEPDANLDARGIELLLDTIRTRREKSMIVVVAHTEGLLRAAGEVVHLGAFDQRV